MIKKPAIFLLIVFSFVTVYHGHAGDKYTDRGNPMIDSHQTCERLRAHLQALTVTIGERSVRLPENLNETSKYITSSSRQSIPYCLYHMPGSPGDANGQVELGAIPRVTVPGIGAEKNESKKGLTKQLEAL